MRSPADRGPALFIVFFLFLLAVVQRWVPSPVSDRSHMRHAARLYAALANERLCERRCCCACVGAFTHSNWTVVRLLCPSRAWKLLAKPGRQVERAGISTEPSGKTRGEAQSGIPPQLLCCCPSICSLRPLLLPPPSPAQPPAAPRCLTRSLTCRNGVPASWLAWKRGGNGRSLVRLSEKNGVPAF